MKPRILGLFDQLGRTEARRLFIPAIVAGAILLVAFCGGEWCGVRINLTGSLARGLYQISAAPDAPLVEFCPPEPFGTLSARRGYRNQGTCPDGDDPLLKPVIATPGDVVVFSDNGLQVNGAPLPNTAPQRADSKRRSLAHYPFGRYRVDPGTVWVASTHNPKSFDSRYFGPVSTAIILCRLKPLLVL